MAPSKAIRVVYLSAQLRNFRATPRTTNIAPDLYSRLKEFGIFRSTHRGRRQGPPRSIPVRVTASKRRRGHTGSGVSLRSIIPVGVIRWDLPTIINTNIHGALHSKLDELGPLSDSENANIVCITETWCKPSIPSQALQLNGYASVRRDRQDGRQCGGIMMYIRDAIPFHHWSELDQQNLESLWVTLRPKRLPRDFSNISIGLIYHPPGAKDTPMLDHIATSIDHIRTRHPDSGIIVCGDTNKLKDQRLKGGYQLKQIVRVPTRGTATLDRIYTNMDSYYDGCFVAPPIGLSDHKVVVCPPLTGQGLQTSRVIQCANTMCGSEW